MVMTLNRMLKRNLAYSRPSANAPTCSGKRTEAPRDAQRNIGIGLWIYTSASGRMCCGSRRDAPKAAKRSTGAGFATSRRSDAVDERHNLRTVAIYQLGQSGPQARSPLHRDPGIAPVPNGMVGARSSSLIAESLMR